MIKMKRTIAAFVLLSIFMLTACTYDPEKLEEENRREHLTCLFPLQGEPGTIFQTIR